MIASREWIERQETLDRVRKALYPYTGMTLTRVFLETVLRPAAMEVIRELVEDLHKKKKQ